MLIQEELKSFPFSIRLEECNSGMWFGQFVTFLCYTAFALG